MSFQACAESDSSICLVFEGPGACTRPARAECPGVVGHIVSFLLAPEAHGPVSAEPDGQLVPTTWDSPKTPTPAPPAGTPSAELVTPVGLVSQEDGGTLSSAATQSCPPLSAGSHGHTQPVWEQEGTAACHAEFPASPGQSLLLYRGGRSAEVRSPRADALLFQGVHLRGR